MRNDEASASIRLPMVHFLGSFVPDKGRTFLKLE
jgi:hypothetical protein